MWKWRQYQPTHSIDSERWSECMYITATESKVNCAFNYLDHYFYYYLLFLSVEKMLRLHPLFPITQDTFTANLAFEAWFLKEPTGFLRMLLGEMAGEFRRYIYLSWWKVFVHCAHTGVTMMINFSKESWKFSLERIILDVKSVERSK